MAVLAVMSLLGVAAGTLWAQQQGPGGRGRGMGAWMFLERSWAAVCFGIQATQEQIQQLWEPYQNAWNTRAQALAAAMQAQDRRAAMEEFQQAMEQLRMDLDNKLKAVLTPEQLQQLERLTQPPQGPGGGRRQGGGQ
jgi:Spy/CpxP family protein refolding chaperone